MKQPIPSMNQLLNQITLLNNQSPGLKSHSYHVSQMARDFGEYLGLCENAINKLVIGGVLHDIGKVSYDDDLLNGAETIDENSINIIHNHTIVGLSLVAHQIIDKEIREIILYHHERIDGCGYPFGLMGNEIPYLVKIISIIDAYDAMTSARGYNSKRTVEEAIDEIKKCAGHQFDDNLAESFIHFLYQFHPLKHHFLS